MNPAVSGNERESVKNEGRGGRSRRVISTSTSVSSYLQLLLDIAIVDFLLFSCCHLIGAGELHNYYAPLAITPILMWFIYSNSGVYRRFPGNLSRCLFVFFAWSKVVGVLVFIAFVSKESDVSSRYVLISWFVISAVVQMLVHIGTDKGIRIYHANHRTVIPSVLVGNSKLGKYLADNINQNPWTTHKIIGAISDDLASEWKLGGLPKLGGFDELYDLVKDYDIRRVYFALPMDCSHHLRDMQIELIDLNIDIVWVPDVFSLHMISPSVKEVAGIPLYYLSESPMVEGARFSKLLMDKLLSLIALVLFSPVMITTAIAVKISSSGPVFFRQERHGLDGKSFFILKFRSMKVHQEQSGEVKQAVMGDNRITAIGSFLRKTSIDELPQIINVLKGDMSLVGPRPHAKSHNEFYADKIDAYMSRHRILPGMTGLAQINGCRGETETIDKMERRVEYDLAYINTWSIGLDMRIIIKTAFTLLSKNAY